MAEQQLLGAPLFGEALKHHQAGRLAEAERLYRQIPADNPRHADSLHMLGLLALQAGDAQRAADLIGQAIAIDGGKAIYCNNMGGALAKLGRREDAVIHFRKALELQPGYATAHKNLGDALRLQAKWAEAAAHYRKAVTQRPDDAEIYNSLGNVLRELRQWDEAAMAFESALKLMPEAAELHNNFGILLKDQGKPDEAAIRYRKALTLKPDYPEVYKNLGNVLYSQDRFDEAIACYQKSLELKPEAVGYATLLVWLHYSQRHSDADILEAARGFASQVEKPSAARAYANTPIASRRLRIGYVSPDFRTHPVGFFLERVLNTHDPAEVEIFCYSNEVFADEVTARLQEAADRWRSIAGVPDDSTAAMIERDGIDILVDLTGHNDANRLPLFATRPAPVQVAWLGFYGTTGLSTIDYILADRFVIPPGEEGNFTEKVWRLPGCYLCYTPRPLDLPLGAFPSAANGFVTFGCFNKRAKISPETIAVWAAILKRVEGSRLFLKDFRFDDAACRSRLLALFAEHGVSADRLTLEPHSPPDEALAAYNRVDIALDPFPFGGCTTTADTLWMGVPLVTLQGQRFAGRMSQSILAALDLNQWVAGDTGEYIEIACRLAAALPDRAGARSDLRRRMAASAFCDGKTFTRGLEDAYRGMWKRWCAGQI